MGWPTALGLFRRAQLTNGVAQSVVTQRLSHVRQLAERCGDRVGPWHVTTADLADYLDSRTWSALTRRNNVKSLRAFFHWATERGYLATDPAAHLLVNLSEAEESAINRRRIVNPEPSHSGPAPRSVPAAWFDLIAGYRAHALSAGLSPNTLKTRTCHLYRLANQLHPMTPSEVTTGDLEEWLAVNPHWTIETRRGVRSSLRALFRWAADAELIPSDPAARLRRIKAAVPCPRPATEDAYAAALAVADDRTGLILRLAAELGLRRAEIARIHRRDVLDTNSGPAILVHGKGGKPRVLPLSASLHRLISHRFADRTACPGEWLFAGKNGHLGAYRVGILAGRALGDRVTLHQLRHRFATVAYRSSGDLLGVQQALGHSSAVTTQRYVAVDPDCLRALVATAGRIRRT